MGRRLMNMGIDQLEQLVDENPGNAQELRGVLVELSHRKTKRAGLLRSRVEGVLRVETPQVIHAASPGRPKHASNVRAPGVTPEQQQPLAAPPPVRPARPGPVATAPTTNASVLEAWTALEVLSPQSFDRPQDLAPGEASRVVDIGPDPLPWQGVRHGWGDRRTFYQVSLGELRLGEAFGAIQSRYTDDAPDRPTSRASALIGIVVCDSKGIPQRNRVAISSFAWALSPALEGQLRQLGQWRQAELRLKEAQERLHRTGPDGQPQPLDRATLHSIHNWLVHELRLRPEWARPPSFAICDYQFLFIQEPPEPQILNSYFLADLLRAGQLMKSGEAPLA